MICFVIWEWRKMSGRKRLYLKNAQLIYMYTVPGDQNGCLKCYKQNLKSPNLLLKLMKICLKK